MRQVNDEKWRNLLLSYGLNEKYLSEVKSRAEGKLGTAVGQLDPIKKFADENSLDINIVMAQVLVRDVFADLAMAAEKWGEVLRTLMKSTPCQQAQYSLQDIEAIRMHCDSFIKYGPKPADEEIPLEATEYTPEEQMSPEAYEAQQALDKRIMEALAKFKPEEAAKRAELLRVMPAEMIDSILDPEFDVSTLIQSTQDNAEPEAN